MKKITSILLTVCLLAFCALPMLAEGLSVEKELSKTKDFYINNKSTLTDWQETLICAATGTSANHSIPELGEEPKAADYAKRILVFLSLNKSTEDDGGVNLIEQLVSAQQENGSFDNNIYTTIFSIEALQAAKATYASEKAVSYLLSQQHEDGGFSMEGTENSDVDTTAMVLTALSNFMDDNNVAAAVQKALEFLQTVQNENGGFFSMGKDNANSLSTVIMAIIDLGQNPESDEWNHMVSSLLRFRNEDGSFRYTEDAAKEANDLATVQAFMALESVRYGASVYKTLASNGSFHPKFDWEAFRPIIIVFLVLCFFSILFWIFIFVHKPRSRTLEETKLDPELLPKLEEDLDEKNEK